MIWKLNSTAQLRSIQSLVSMPPKPFFMQSIYRPATAMTMLTHTLEVSQIARTIAKALRLNEDLVEAIALGHDLGHTPFGHAGERALDQVHPGGFAHYKQSVRVVEVLEKNGNGLNLTWEVRNGIMNHRTSGNPFTLEGQVVRFSDKIAYIHQIGRAHV